MRVRMGLVLALMGFVAVTGIARADDKSEIAALYKKLEKAMAAKDANAVMAVGTKDFSYTEGGKTLTGDEMMRQMKQQFAMMTGTPRSKTAILSCKVNGKT